MLNYCKCYKTRLHIKKINICRNKETIYYKVFNESKKIDESKLERLAEVNRTPTCTGAGDFSCSNQVEKQTKRAKSE